MFTLKDHVPAKHWNVLMESSLNYEILKLETLHAVWDPKSWHEMDFIEVVGKTRYSSITLLTKIVCHEISNEKVTPTDPKNQKSNQVGFANLTLVQNQSVSWAWISRLTWKMNIQVLPLKVLVTRQVINKRMDYSNYLIGTAKRGAGQAWQVGRGL